jgi:hypothetical protein
MASSDRISLIDDAPTLLDCLAAIPLGAALPPVPFGTSYRRHGCFIIVTETETENRFFILRYLPSHAPVDLELGKRNHLIPVGIARRRDRDIEGAKPIRNNTYFLFNTKLLLNSTQASATGVQVRSSCSSDVENVVDRVGDLGVKILVFVSGLAALFAAFALTAHGFS